MKLNADRAVKRTSCCGSACLVFFSFFALISGVLIFGHSLFADRFLENSRAAADNYSPVFRPGGRILVILIDSLQKNTMFNGHMPFISASRERGAWGVSEVISTPITVAGVHAMFSGVAANPLAIFDDFTSSVSPYDNLFRRVAARNRRVVLFNRLLGGMYGDIPGVMALQPMKFNFSQYREGAEYIFNQAYGFLKKEKWDLAVVPFYSLDWLGHLETPKSVNYVSFAGTLDDYVRQLVSLTGRRDVVLITSEHGMDDNGFHMNRVPEVMETGFILWGPEIKKSGPGRVLQIDWAPTLSVLSGVSPFYDSPALPALDLLDAPEGDKSLLSGRFSRIFSGSGAVFTAEELRMKQKTVMEKKISGATGLMVMLLLLLSAGFLIYIIVDDIYPAAVHHAALISIFSVLGLFLLTFSVSHSGVFDYLSAHMPFSANFILSHFAAVAAAFAGIFLLGGLCYRLTGNCEVRKKFFPILIFTLIFTGIFTSSNPYHPLNWGILFTVTAWWAVSRRWAWAVIACSLLGGLLIRRMALYSSEHPVYIPDRWIMAVIASAVCILYLWRKSESEAEKRGILFPGVLCFAPAIGVLVFAKDVKISAVLLLVCLVPVIFASARKISAGSAWLALWVVFFYLGTSGSIQHMTHIVAFPLFLAAWSVADGRSGLFRGVIAGIVLWILYLLPGNGFDLKLMELRDGFIMGSATTKHIGYTAAIIACRYILPAAVLIWGMRRAVPFDKRSRMASAMFLPVICAMSIIIVSIISSPVIGFPWEEIVRLTVLSGYAAMGICAFVIVVSVEWLTGITGTAQWQ